MPRIERQNIAPLNDKIIVYLSKEDYYPAFEKNLKQTAKTVNVPGFRKGMVPTSLLKKMYGQSIYQEQVLKEAGNQLNKYLDETKPDIFGQPLILPNEGTANLNFNEPEEYNFAFEVGLKPQIEIPLLTNPPALTHYKIRVTDEMLGDEIMRLRRRFGQKGERDEITGKDDLVVLKLSEEGIAPIEESLIIGELKDTLQEKLIGKKVGETIEASSEEIREENKFKKIAVALDELAAEKDQIYTLSIAKVEYIILQDVNVALFSQVFPKDDIFDEAAFTDKLKGELGREYNRITSDRLHNDMFEALVHETPIELPVTFLKRFMKEGGETLKNDKEVEREWPTFEHQLRWTLISDKVIQDNHLSVSREEVLGDVKGKVLTYFGLEDEDEAPWMEEYITKLSKEQKTMDETYQRLLFDKLFASLESTFQPKEEEIEEKAFFESQPKGHHHHH